MSHRIAFVESEGSFSRRQVLERYRVFRAMETTHYNTDRRLIIRTFRGFRRAAVGGVSGETALLRN